MGQSPHQVLPCDTKIYLHLSSFALFLDLFFDILSKKKRRERERKGGKKRGKEEKINKENTLSIGVRRVFGAALGQ